MADTVSVTQAVLLRAFKLVDGIAGEINGVPNEPTNDMADDIAMDLAEALRVPFDEHWPEAAAAALASTQPAPAFPREEVAAEVRALRDTLLWYRDNTAMCRKIGSIGEPARKALDADGGKRADEVMDNSPVLAALLQGKQP